MALNIGRNTLDADSAVAQIVSQLNVMYDQLVSFRVSVVAGVLRSDLLFSVMPVLTGARAFVATETAAVGSAALSAAYQRKFSTAAGYDPSAQWATTKAALDTLIANIKSGMPKDATGRPVFFAFASDDQFTTFNVTLTGGQVSTLTGNIDAVLASLT